ncbi:hypothetical protein [Parachryseolinea silvisoli]|uniref:hypothetical protein n=1 Tax=Parachryseolinea silvisoli TaxID=2873601 RepID=UPI002265AC45|nr:hypothetical protein [Parachryseolinea silvisoli]MCD9016002.1 hypothetical protein [Parachryseolinea silvisoli]
MEQDKSALAKRYAKLSNDQLLEMLENRHDYTPIALEVLQEEVNSRQISKEEVATYKFTATVNTEILKARALEPLPLWQKAFYFFGFIVPIFLSYIIFAFELNRREDGYTTKLRQTRFFRWAGFISFMLVVFVSLDMPFLFYILWPASFALAYKFAPKPKAATE